MSELTLEALGYTTAEANAMRSIHRLIHEPPPPPVQRASAGIESIRPQSNNERRASWAAKYFGHGHHQFTPAAPEHTAQPVPLPKRTGAAGTYTTKEPQ